MRDPTIRLADDLLTGARPIAKEIGWSEREIYAAHARGTLPLFRIGRAICARRSSLHRHIEALEAERLPKVS